MRISMPAQATNNERSLTVFFLKAVLRVSSQILPHRANERRKIEGRIASHFHAAPRVYSARHVVLLQIRIRNGRRQCRPI